MVSILVVLFANQRTNSDAQTLPAAFSRKQRKIKNVSKHTTDGIQVIFFSVICGILLF